MSIEDLKDIQGLDEISAWPLALGWWLVIAVMVLGFTALLYYAFKRYKYRRSWQYESFTTLSKIEQQLLNVNQQDKTSLYKNYLHQLAIEIRRIAMQTFARETCASLVGKQWLTWLQEHDPQKFDWINNGTVLIDYQYMPQLSNVDPKNINAIIAAAKRWVRRC